MNDETILLTRLDVQKMTTLSRSSIYHMISNGEFPEPIALSGRRVAWLKGDIDEWIQSKIANAMQNKGQK